MVRLVAPVHYPLTSRSKRTLSEAIEIADNYDADMTVLHVNLYQAGRSTSHADLRYAVETEFGHLPRAEYVVRSGFLVEETIIDEVSGEDADIVIIGGMAVSRWRRLVRRILLVPDIETALEERLTCTVISVTP